MARKKKTSAKKRNKTPAAAAGGATKTGVDSISPVQSLEGMDELLMDNGKHIDFVRLVKCMPYAVQQLKEGTLSQDEFKTDVISAFVQQYNSRNVYMDFDAIVLRISIACQPGPPIREADTREMMFLQEFAEKNFESFVQEVGDFYELPDKAYTEAAILALQKSTEKTCRTFSTRMDLKHFKGEKGAFLRWCPLYGALSASKFADAVASFNLGEQLILTRKALSEVVRVGKDVAFACGAVKHCLDEAWVECWECGKKGKSIPRCSRCSVAQYCGQDCQRKAWNGHKAVCTTNKNVYAFLLENWRIVDEAHETGKLHGVDLNFPVDYSTAQFLMHAVLCPEYFGLPADGPSMKYFYQNLGHVVQGDWWVWSEPGTVDQFAEKCRQSDDGDCAEPLQEVCLMMCFDLHGCAASKNNGVVTTKTIDAIVKDHPLTVKNKGMPAEFFLKVYLDCRVEKNDLLLRQKIVNLAMAQGLALLKNVGK